MKRSFAQYCQSPVARANTGTFRLAQFDADLLGLIVAWLDIDDVRSLFFCLLVEADVGDQILSLKRLLDVETDLDSKQCAALAFCLQLLTNRFPEIHLDCMMRHLHAISDATNQYATAVIVKSGAKALKDARSKMVSVRWLVSNEYYPLLLFLDTATCDRCQSKLHTVRYWPKTRTLYLCTDCHERMTDSMTTKQSAKEVADGYAWITATMLKSLCWVPNNIKASDFAQANDIRLLSRQWLDSDTVPVPDKEYYFLLDAKPHVRSLGDRKSAK